MCLTMTQIATQELGLVLIIMALTTKRLITVTRLTNGMFIHI